MLKGPQGTLFGRNTEGGAVNIVTKQPSGEFHLNATAGIGNYGAYKGEVHLDLPEFHELRVKIDGVVTQRDGWCKNPLTGAAGFNAYDKRGVHAEVLWKPTDRFHAPTIRSTPPTTPRPRSICSCSAAGHRTSWRRSAPIQPQRARTAIVGVPQQPSVGKVRGHALTLDWHAGAGADAQVDQRLSRADADANTTTAPRPAMSAPTATSSAGFRRQHHPLPFSRYSLAEFRQNQFSQEVQAIGEIGRGQVRRRRALLSGACRRQRPGLQHQPVQPRPAPPTRSCRSTSAPTSRLGGAAARLHRAADRPRQPRQDHQHRRLRPGDLDAGDARRRLHLTGGLRWTRRQEGRAVHVNNALPVDRQRRIAPDCSLNARWSRVDPMVNLAVDVTPRRPRLWQMEHRLQIGRRQLALAGICAVQSGKGLDVRDRRQDRILRSPRPLQHRGLCRHLQGHPDRLPAPYVRRQRHTARRRARRSSTLNAPGTGGINGVEAELTLTPTRGLTLHGSYALQQCPHPAGGEPLSQRQGRPQHARRPDLPGLHAERFGERRRSIIELPLTGVTLRAHLDGNYDSGFYANIQRSRVRRREQPGQRLPAEGRCRVHRQHVAGARRYRHGAAAARR